MNLADDTALHLGGILLIVVHPTYSYAQRTEATSGEFEVHLMPVIHARCAIQAGELWLKSVNSEGLQLRTIYKINYLFIKRQ